MMVLDYVKAADDSSFTENTHTRGEGKRTGRMTWIARRKWAGTVLSGELGTVTALEFD